MPQGMSPTKLIPGSLSSGAIGLASNEKLGGFAESHQPGPKGGRAKWLELSWRNCSPHRSFVPKTSDQIIAALHVMEILRWAPVNPGEDFTPALPKPLRIRPPGLTDL